MGSQQNLIYYENVEIKYCQKVDKISYRNKILKKIYEIF